MTAGYQSPQKQARQFEAAGNFTAAYEAYLDLWNGGYRTTRIAEKTGLAAERSGNHLAAVHWYSQALTLPQVRSFVWAAYGRSLERIRDWNRASYAYHKYARIRRRHGNPVYKHQGGSLDYSAAIRFGAMTRPDYAHAVRHAALLAQQLGVPAIRVAELGVASGRGLVALEEHAATMQELTGVEIQVWGFDTAQGLPEPTDYRDVPHFFGGGDYTMQDPDELRRRLTHAELVIGNAGETVRQWIGEGPPIGALMFDMDLYSSTAGVLALLTGDAEEDQFLPRVSLAFDDVVPKDAQYNLKDYSSFTGEAAAITDFNAGSTSVKIDPDRYLSALPEHAAWYDSCYLMHRFDHPAYNTRIRESAVDHRPLEPVSSPPET